MNEQQAKILTAYLGECWHEKISVKCEYMKGDFICSRKYHQWKYFCESCGKLFLIDEKGIDRDTINIKRRTFTTPDDYFAIRDKAVEKGDWVEFCIWIAKSKQDSISFIELADNITDKIKTPLLFAEWLEWK